MPTADRDHRRTAGDELLSNSSVTLFYSMTVLRQTLAKLREAGYHVVLADAGTWRTAREMHLDLARALDFPEYYGENLDAFNDCMRDVADRDYGFPHDATGLVLVLTGYDRFAHEFPGIAYDLVDVFAVRSRDALRTGEQLICLIQSTDPRFSLPPVGATPVIWNRAEWLNASRGL